MKAVGIYIFQGGFTLGVQKHFKVLSHLEDGQFGVATVEYNLPAINIYSKFDEWPTKQHKGVDYVFANPPCNSWSIAGSRFNRPHWKDEPNAACWPKAVAAAFAMEPKVIHIESVRPIYKLGREMLNDIAKEGRQRGYQTTVLLEDAIDCNLPQKRPRFVLCLSKYQYLASPTHGKDVTPGEVLKAWAKAKNVPDGNKRRAAQSSEKDQSGDMRVLKHTPPGGRLAKYFAIKFPKALIVDGKMKGRPSMLKYRVHPDKPSPTQPGGAILFHPTQNRYLSIGESSALCGYPFNYEFIGSVSSAYAQMGKAVMPNVGEHLARDAAATIRKKHKLSKADIAQVQEITIFRDRVEVQNIVL